MSGYIDIMESYLKKIDAELSEDFQLDGVFEIMEELRVWILRLEEKLFMSGAVSDDKIISVLRGKWFAWCILMEVHIVRTGLRRTLHLEY